MKASVTTPNAPRPGKPRRDAREMHKLEGKKRSNRDATRGAGRDMGEEVAAAAEAEGEEFKDRGTRLVEGRD